MSPDNSANNKKEQSFYIKSKTPNEITIEERLILKILKCLIISKKTNKTKKQTIICLLII